VSARFLGIVTSPARALPDFLVIGTKRGGTTSTYRYLLDHPQILPLFPSAAHLPMRADLKGVHFFDTGFSAGPAWYRSHFPSRVRRRLVAQRAGSPVLSGEASPYYLFHPHAALRARALVPQAKLIVLLRDPVERAHSHYKEQRRRGIEELDTFAKAVEAEPGRLAGETERLLTDPRYRSFAHEHQSYVEQGMYAASLERWLRSYPTGQIHIVRSEDLYTDAQGTYDGILDFLDLPSFRLTHPVAFNVTSSCEIDPGLRRELEQRFSPHNLALEALIGRSIGWSAR
jgi:hypothetical protein